MEKILSLCMIVKNEAGVLARCLSCVKDVVDEIIIVDTGSTDKTKKIANKYTDKIFDFKWCDDFSKARNYSFSLAQGKYIMWLDADDYIDEENVQRLISLKQKLDGKTDVYMLKYNTAFDNGRPIFSFFRERILKNDKSFKWNGVVHEVICPHGKVEYLNIDINHFKDKVGDKDRNLKIYRKYIKDGNILNSREGYYYARELFYHGFYRKCIAQLNKTLKNNDLWIEDRIGGMILKATCLQFLGKNKESRLELFKTFEISFPRAKSLCLIGDSFMAEGKYLNAILWYESAMKRDKNLEKNGFVESDYFDYYPALSLCVCYFNLNHFELAEEYNNFAISIRKSPETLANKRFFEEIRCKTKR